ncbi:2-polyprenyl-6-methoxyphenol hydroxylase [Amycolatopsis arida]|uniref:2-polyprenyl-6-methoxyphenol hydroxylase n=1 Tax=Amycolatopsis arida TaxID=587909 RepID=A0A1I5V5Q5_9PSEU|nr:FAD-dependent monooxygenase [Amycolatopsis arida]TDX91143.1 2-polyprenyl-6-methoxyphenol hydroxylase-like FAD-dependent oxidoreductase [Amycolatopsis arida]SFQ02266.1 2-polyprenyl-6-methoxyphenol hydroxylase [Amycolatopsis arida]
MTTDVVIVGGGPNGLMLAGELGLAGVRPIVLERLAAPSEEPKANGLLGQVVRMVDRRGLVERLGGGPGPPRPNSAYVMFAAMALDLSLLDESPIYGLPVPQRRIVQALDEWARELGAEIRRGHEVIGLTQDDDAVTVEVTGPDGTYVLRTRYLVGADGAHSVTRKLCGIGFPGVSYDRTTLRSAHATVPGEWVDPTTGGLTVPGYGTVAPFLPHRTERGGFSYAPFPGQPPLISTTEWDQPGTEAPVSLDELRASVARVLGADVPLGPPTGEGPHVLRRLSGGNTRVAERFADRRVFLVGDAAHVYAAGGGPGLNLGLQDAVNLGWKLAREVDGSDVRYDMGVPDAHPMVGRFAPDLELHTPNGTIRLAELTRTARPLLLDLTEDESLAEAVSEWDDQVDVVTARPGGRSPAVTALLLRPDCYVAWASATPRAGSAARDGLRAALRRWFRPTEPARA